MPIVFFLFLRHFPIVTAGQEERAYRADPAHVGADLGEDGGLFGVVAAEAGAKADDAVDLPGSSTILAVQGAARVPLFQRHKQTLKTSH